MPQKSKPSSDIQGAGRLAIDAIQGITDLVEAMHYTITSAGGLRGDSERQRTTGITGMVYQNIRTISGMTGIGLDALLGKLPLYMGESESSPRREAVLAALNGVLGDYLAEKENPLAIPMQLRRNGRPVAVEDQTFAELVRQSKGKILFMAHGSCMNDLQWDRQGHDHGAALANDLGYLPVYLHYNSGRHTSENGRDLAHLLETFTSQLPPSTELTIIAHSMGGLVSRSACYYAELSNYSWLNRLQKIIFLGTPHHGALLERGGNWVDILLDISPYSAPFSRLGKIRSAGITDLRYGNVLEGDWKGRDRFEHTKDDRTPLPLPHNVACYAIAATTGKESSNLGDDLVGDGLVTIGSALGHHQNLNRNLGFPETHQWIGRDMNHLDLLNHPNVYETIKQWLVT